MPRPNNFEKSAPLRQNSVRFFAQIAIYLWEELLAANPPTTKHASLAIWINLNNVHNEKARMHELN